MNRRANHLFQIFLSKYIIENILILNGIIEEYQRELIIKK